MQKDMGWLFEKAPAGWVPQTGGARADKRALWWRPGRNTRRGTGRAVLHGCTQLAFPPGVEIAEGPCAVCWVGIDIDIDEAAPLSVLAGLSNLGCSIRTSSGGTGLHLIWRLETPPIVDYSLSNRMVRALLVRRREQVEKILPVCSADRRMFWLWGGANRWISRTDRLEPVVLAVRETAEAMTASGQQSPDLKISAGIQSWVDRMIHDGVLRGSVGAHNRIHLGTIVPWLRSLGERVTTKSGLSSTWHVNGHLDILPDQLQLYSYADSRIIWSWADNDRLMEGF